MRLYDTATRSVRPIDPGEDGVGLYVCGITPYDGGHLGHAFTFHVFDVITRRLRADGRVVRSVRNITDVDDDILRVARERSVDFRSLARSQVEGFDRDMAALGILPVDEAPRATEHVAEMVDWVHRLESLGFAYCVDGWVYFDTHRFPGYGRLSGLDAATMTELSRERGADPDDRRKRHPLDFVLWQPSAVGEPSWPSPWGEGRPGWHIECTALSVDKLGTPIAVHGGGTDLIYPHHESELAQAQAAGIVDFVRHWVHVAMVEYQGEKMSKSLGNLVFVRELLQSVPGPAVRILLSQHHYRAAWSYDDEELHSAEDRYRSYLGAMRGGGGVEAKEAVRLRASFLERVDDDLDLPGALEVMDSAVLSVTQVPAATTMSAVGADELLGGMLELLGAGAVPVEA